MTQTNSKEQFNVKNFGAVGDGITDDTAAINATYAAAAAAMGTPGGAGCVYFPPSTDFYRVTTLKTPSMDYGHGWLVSVFHNGLLVDTVIPGNNNRFIGLTSNFRGLGGSFVSTSFAEWQQPKNAISPLLHIQGGDQIVFEGINFAAQTPGMPAIKIENNVDGSGTVYITFRGCVAGTAGDSATQPSMVVHGAFGLRMSECSLGNIYLSMGFVTIEHSFVHSIYYQNCGAPLTIDTSGGPVNDVTLRRVKMADTVGTS